MAMDEEIRFLNENNTWELVDMPEKKKLVHTHVAQQHLKGALKALLRLHKFSAL